MELQIRLLQCFIYFAYSERSLFFHPAEQIQRQRIIAYKIGKCRRFLEIAEMMQDAEHNYGFKIFYIVF